ncbi:hypothetical protein GPALN_006374 [Globodera pallida]|nr:hypothetical protein GPALN_006374 [Globodera pallida]
MLADMGDNTNGSSVHSAAAVAASRRNHPNGNGASSLAQAEAEAANATLLLCNVCSDGHDNGREEDEVNCFFFIMCVIQVQSPTYRLAWFRLRLSGAPPTLASPIPRILGPIPRHGLQNAVPGRIVANPDDILGPVPAQASEMPAFALAGRAVPDDIWGAIPTPAIPPHHAVL